MINRVYQHYKNGKRYRVLSVGKHHETHEELVSYTDSKGNTWVRPKEEFLGNVDFGGRNIPRFKLVSQNYVFREIHGWIIQGFVISLGAIVAMTLVIAIIQIAPDFRKHFQECTTRMVQDVNSCDYFGNCGVRFTDGSAGVVHLPVIDEPVEVCK